MSHFVYAKDVNLEETISDGKGGQVFRYGARLNPVADAKGVHRPLLSGQLFDRLNPTRRIMPKNIEEEVIVKFSGVGTPRITRILRPAKANQMPSILPGGGLYGD